MRLKFRAGADNAPASAPFLQISARARILALTCACAGASALLYAVDPRTAAAYPPCLLYSTTGMYCAGCGATRAAHALLHGRVLSALHDNVLFVALLPVALFSVARFCRQAWRADSWPPIGTEPGRTREHGLRLFLLLALFTVARNLPGPAFDWLRPLS